MYCTTVQGPTVLVTSGQSSRKHLHSQPACHCTLICPAQRSSHVKHSFSIGYTTRPRRYQQRVLAGSMQNVPVLKVVSASWIGAGLSLPLSEHLLPCDRTWFCWAVAMPTWRWCAALACSQCLASG